MAETVIELHEVTREFRRGHTVVKAVDGVTLAVHRGEFVAVMGKSGSGKSTLLHVMSGLLRPTSGSVRLLGRDVGALSDDALTLLRRDQIGFVFQFFNLLPTLTAAENVALPLLLSRVRPAQATARARQMLDMVGLADRAHHKPDELSGGQMQRVAIARALAQGLTAQFLVPYGIQAAPVAVGAADVALALAVGIGASLFAAYGPARETVSVSPVEAMRPAEIHAATERHGLARALAGLGLIVAVVVFVWATWPDEGMLPTLLLRAWGSALVVALLDAVVLLPVLLPVLGRYVLQPLQVLLFGVTGRLAIANTLFASLRERQREFGILRAVGARRGDVMRVVLGEALSTGLIGGSLGIGAGMALFALFVASSEFVNGTSVDMVIPWIPIATAVAVSLLLAPLVGMLPARRAAQLEVVEALRYE